MRTPAWWLIVCCALPLTCCVFGACVAPRVQDPVNRPQEPHLEESRVVMADGASLPLARWLPVQGRPRAVIVAVHGINDHSGSFAATGQYLAANGFVVYAFDQRGFGATEQKGIWAGADVMAHDASQVSRLLRLRHPGVPVYGLGDSLGGAVLLHALVLEPRGWIDGVVLLAPAVWNRRDMPWYQRAALRLLAHSWRGLKLSAQGLDLMRSDNPEALRRLQEDPLFLRKTRVDVLWGTVDLMDAVTTEAVRFDVPLLILYGANDEVMPPDAICAWVRSLDAAQNWQFAVYPNGWHMLAHDLQAATVWTDLAAWFGRPGTALPSNLDAREQGATFCAAFVAE